MTNEQLNRIWPGWVIVDILGQGAYGTVYKAVHSENGLQTWAAVKEISIPQSEREIQSLRTEGMTEQETQAYLEGIKDEFVREIRILESLKGIQNIVNLEDFKVEKKAGSIGWDIYIRMELLTPLQERLGAQLPGEKEVLQLGIDICNALVVCEKKQIIHRDIKPGNIFIHEMGSYKLGDFGIARRMEAIGSSLSRKGTPNYMAPEVANGTRYDKRVDIYSLGIVMYRLLNENRLPFLDNNEQNLNPTARENAVARRIAGEKLKAPCKASPLAAEVILKACAWDPNERYNSAAEFRTALLRAQLASGSSAGAVYNIAPGSNVYPGNNIYPGNNVYPGGSTKTPTGSKTENKKKKAARVAVIALIALILGGSLLLSLNSRGKKNTSSKNEFVNEGQTAETNKEEKDSKTEETKEESMQAETSEPSETSSECTHERWKEYNGQAHACVNCGYKEAHNWVEEDGTLYCTECFFIDETYQPEPVIEETNLALLTPTAVTNYGKDDNGNPTTIYTATEDVAIGNWPDNFGNTYNNAYKFWVLYQSGSSHIESITYNVSGYDSIYGQMVLGEYQYSRCHEGATVFFNFYLDGTLVYTSKEFTAETQPESYSIDINGGSLLKIECVTYEGVVGEGLATAILTKEVEP